MIEHDWGRVEEMCSDAEGVYNEALKELDTGNMRNAAEKAWGATLGYRRINIG